MHKKFLGLFLVMVLMVSATIIVRAYENVAEPDEAYLSGYGVRSSALDCCNDFCGIKDNQFMVAYSELFYGMPSDIISLAIEFLGPIDRHLHEGAMIIINVQNELEPVISIIYDSNDFDLFSSSVRCCQPSGSDIRVYEDWQHGIRTNSYCVVTRITRRYTCMTCSRVVQTSHRYCSSSTRISHTWGSERVTSQWIEHGPGCGRPNICTVVTQWTRFCSRCDFRSPSSRTTRAPHTCHWR